MPVLLPFLGAASDATVRAGVSFAQTIPAMHIFLRGAYDFTERDFADPRVYYLVAALLTFYYVIAYKWLQRDRDALPAVSQYQPPEQISPAAMRYLLTGDSDRQTVAAVVLHLAARGIVTIKCLDNFYLITKRVDSLPANLPAEEAAAFTAMFLKPAKPVQPNTPRPLAESVLPAGSFLLHPIAGTNFNTLAKTIHASLRGAYEHNYFTRNLIYSVPAALLSVGCIVANAMMPGTALFMISFILTGILLINFTPYARDLVRGRMQGDKSAYAAALLMLYMTWVAMMAGGAKHFTNTYELILIYVVVLNIWFPQRFRTTTDLGRKLLNQIEGYREFLMRVEVDRLHRMLEPEWTPSATTQNLAYAVALDLHGAWEDYLANSDFHSVAWAPRDKRPTLPGMPIPGSCELGGLGFLRKHVWRWVGIILFCMLIGVFKPSDIAAPWLTLCVAVAGLLALYGPLLFRGKSADLTKRQPID